MQLITSPHLIDLTELVDLVEFNKTSDCGSAGKQKKINNCKEIMRIENMNSRKKEER